MRRGMKLFPSFIEANAGFSSTFAPSQVKAARVHSHCCLLLHQKDSPIHLLRLPWHPGLVYSCNFSCCGLSGFRLESRRLGGAGINLTFTLTNSSCLILLFENRRLSFPGVRAQQDAASIPKSPSRS